LDKFYHFGHLSKEKGLIHAVSRKEREEAYAFSLALHTGEEKAQILANRERLRKALSLEAEAVFVTAMQTHSDHVSVIEKREMRGWSGLEDAVEDCDAMVTDLPGVILTILTADCVPILLYDPIQRVVAAVHAGWRGTESKVVMKTVGVMKERFSSNPADILAGIAPAIGECCYEVGEEVAVHFSEYPEALVAPRGGKFMLDLPRINLQQMTAAGLQREHIEMSGICTACEVEHFFSYRREQGCSGRFMSMIGLEATEAT